MYGRSQMQIPIDLLITVAFEEINQKIDLFNQNQNAITLRSEALRGDVTENSLFKDIVDFGMSFRDTTSNDPVTAKSVETFKETWTKINKRFGPFPMTDDQWKKVGENPNRAAVLLGQKFAEGRLDSMIKSSIASLVGLLTKASATIFDPSATALPVHLYGALNLFGDMQDNCELIVMHSFPFNVLQQVLATPATSTDMPFTQQVVGTGTIQRLAGKTYYVIDDPSLVGASQHYSLFLPAGAAECVESEEIGFIVDDISGQENIVRQYQGENAYNVNLKNCQFADAGIAGKVTDTNLIDSTKWTNHNSSVKTGPGVLWISDD